MAHNSNGSDRSDTHDSTGTGADSTTDRTNWMQHDELSVAVVEAVAAATDRTTSDLPPLQRTVDPDALDRLLSQEQSSSVTVSFEYADADVWILSNGTIEIQVDQDSTGKDE